MEISNPNSFAVRYSIALFAPALMAGVMQVTWPAFELSPVGLFLLAIMFCSWYGGPGPSLLSLLLSFPLAEYFFIAPYFAAGQQHRSHVIKLLTLATIGLCTVLLSALTHKEKRRAEINVQSALLAEEARRQSAARYQLLFDRNPLPMWAYDLETLAFLAVNDAAVEHYGYSREEFLRMTIQDVCPTEDVATRVTGLSNTIEEWDARPHTWRHRIRDGSIIDVEIRLRSMDLAGRPARLVLVNDVTERKHMERAISESEESLARAQEIAHIGSWDWDLLTNRVQWSEEMYRIYGVTRKEFGETYEAAIDFTHPDDKQRVRQFIADALEDFKPSAFDYRIVRKDGSIRIINAQARVYPGADGRAFKMAGTLQDITERKAAEEALREAEQNYRDIFENAVEGIFQTSPAGGYICANPSLARMLGYDSPEDLLRERGENREQHYQNAALHQEYFRLLEEHGVVRDFEYEELRKDGKRINVLANARAVRDGEGKLRYYEGTTQDISERKQAQTRSAAFAILARKLSGAQVPLNAARTIADTAHELFGWESFALKLYDAKEDIIHPLLCIDTVDGQPRDVTPLIADFGPTPKARLVIGQGAQLTLREEPYEFDEDSVPFGDTGRPSASVMSVPIRHSAKVIGILSIQSYRPHAYDREALNNLQALADHCGAALNRIWAEEALRSQKEMLQKIFDHIPAMITFFDADGRIRVVNREWECWRGWSLEELQNRPADLLTEGYPDPEYRQKVLEMAAESNGRPFELKTRVRDGRVVDTIWSVINLSDGTRIGLGQDITERKQTEDALRESEERYRELFENAKDATYVHDLSGRYTSVNRATEKLTGHTRAEIIGRSFADFVPPDELPIITEHLCRKLAEKGETTYESKITTRDGRQIPVEVSSHLIYQNGSGVGVQGTARDITERKRAEERLREYEKVVEGLEEMIIVVDRGFRYLLANRAYLKYRGLDREELLGRLVPDIVSKDLFEGVIKAKLERAFQGHVVEYPLHLSYPELGERDLLCSYFPIEGPSGIDRVACVFQDITERQRAEEALRQSEERFSKAFQSSPAALSIALLEDGKLLEVNEAFLRMTGFNREEVIGRSTVELELWTNHDRGMIAKALRERGAVANLDIKFQQKSGGIREGLFSAELIQLDGGPSILAIVQDITERNRAAEALQNYPRQLIKAQEAERQRIARELHDQVGQVLTAIHLNLQTVWETCESSEARALIDEGVAMVDEALAQVRDLSFELRPSLLDDLGLVTALRWYAARFEQRTGIHAITAIDLSGKGTRLGRELETACFRIVQEALTNVVRHAGAKNISITLRSCDDQLQLSIKDDGAGFDAYAQNLSAFAGHVGLRGMRERALALGGQLEIKSSPSRGTVISAHFPGPGKEE
jgi:PAS domain S-box-containing protein